MNGVIVKYIYNHKLFCIFVKENKICLGYFNDDNVIEYNFSDDERKVITKVFNSLVVNEKNSILAKKFTLKGRQYYVYYDLKKRLYFWKSKDGSIDLDINKYLNLRYNHINCVVCRSNDDWEDVLLRKKHHSVFEREIFIDNVGKVLRVFVSSTLSLAMLASMVGAGYMAHKYFPEWANEYYTNRSINEVDSSDVPVSSVLNEGSSEANVVDSSESLSQNKKAYSWEEIEHIINENSILNDSDKEFIKKMQFVFDENHQYMNLSLVKERLSTLQIKHINSFDSSYDDLTGNELPESILGFYVPSENFIELFNDRLSYDDTYNAAFIHEFSHVLQDGGNRKVKELSNEVFTQETLRKMYEEGLLDGKYNFSPSTIGYADEIIYYYWLAELIPSNVLLQYQFDPNEAYLVQALAGSPEEQLQVFEILDDIDNMVNGDKIDNSIEDKLNYFYEKEGMESIDANFNVQIMQGWLYKDSPTLESTLQSFILNEVNPPDWFGSGAYDDMKIVDISPKTYFFDYSPSTEVMYRFMQTGEIVPVNDDSYDGTLYIDDNVKEHYKQYIADSSKNENFENSTKSR